MTRLEKILRLNEMLLMEMPFYGVKARSFQKDEQSQRTLLRSLMNLRPAAPLDDEFLQLQDELLKEECAEKGVEDVGLLKGCEEDPRLVLWKGDITRLNADAIVNAANPTLLGCFSPCHPCIDNAIHSYAGLQLRDECNALMEKQGHEEENGQVKLTHAYNLPSKYVMHTVGPHVENQVSDKDRRDLASCYLSCLQLASACRLKTVAFCCIATGEYCFPHEEAARIAVSTVKEYLKEDTVIEKVVFNVFEDEDERIYRKLLNI